VAAGGELVGRSSFFSKVKCILGVVNRQGSIWFGRVFFRCRRGGILFPKNIDHTLVFEPVRKLVYSCVSCNEARAHVGVSRAVFHTCKVRLEKLISRGETPYRLQTSAVEVSPSTVLAWPPMGDV
jgi:hypothetical protein